MDKSRKRTKKRLPNVMFRSLEKPGENLYFTYYLDASSTATATATVAPTMGCVKIVKSTLNSFFDTTELSFKNNHFDAKKK